MSQEFENWLGQIAAEDDSFGEADLSAEWRSWMEQTFRERGAIAAKELTELGHAEQARLAAAALLTPTGFCPQSSLTPAR